MRVHYMAYGQVACGREGPPGSWKDDDRWSGEWKDVTCPPCLASKKCGSCRHLRKRTPKDIKVEAGYDTAEHWCDKIGSPTTPVLLRCGGDDWEA